MGFEPDVTAVKGQCPRPLDEEARFVGLRSPSRTVVITWNFCFSNAASSYATYRV